MFLLISVLETPHAFVDDSRLEELKTLLPNSEAASRFKLSSIDFEKVQHSVPSVSC